jgi:hypothetical protein
MYSNLLWIPVDLPKFPVSNRLLHLYRDEGFAFWSFARLTEKKDSPYDIADWKSEVKDQFPEIIEWANSLPIASIRNVKINLQNRSVKPHIDFTMPYKNPVLWSNNTVNEPCGYRVLLHGKTINTLYMINSAGEKVYCTQPEDTDTYLLRHTNGMHGVEDDEDRITMYLHLEINAEQHKKILEKSVEKYSNYAIYDK